MACAPHLKLRLGENGKKDYHWPWKQDGKNGLRQRQALSLAAGLGINFAHQFLTTGREPSISKLMQLLAALGPKARHFVIYGDDIRKDDAEFLDVLAKLSPDQRAAVKVMLLSFLQEKSDKE
jgi:hypothetical protein